MIGLDTNILVRYLVQDDPVQSPIATHLIERRLSEDDPGFVTIVAMVETAWVLERIYGFSDADIAAAIERMLQIDLLVVENEQDVFTAMVELAEGRGSFADALIGARGAGAGCSHTLTFDRKALRIPGFELP
ncbi:MAG: type II toxin-antitoxin system VapC family toxin [Rhizomicrobium sp.]